MVKDINPSGSGVYVGIGHPTETTQVNGILFFAANDGDHGYELWKTDGTPDGTEMVKDINSTGDGIVVDIDNMLTVESVNGIVFFAANDGTNGVELWKSDGTEAGTVMVKNINPYGDGIPSLRDGRFLINVEGELLFSGNNGVNGVELYRSDGSGPGTTMVGDIHPAGDSRPLWGTVIGKTLFFTADDGKSGRELWKYESDEFPWLPFLPAILKKQK